MKRSEKMPGSSSDNDDSLADFKTPRIERVAEVSNKLKILNDKRAKKSSTAAKKQSSKKKEGTSSYRANNAKDQPSIESSFFKATNQTNRDGHTCPLCMKYFPDAAVGISHSKSCAAKNNVSTKKLLAAVALQERQAGERLAIGLPAGPFVQPKSKAPKKYRDSVSNIDPDLQLAIALSESLQETEMEKELEEAILLTSEHTGEDPNIDMTNSQRRQTLKNYGFSTNKPVVPTIFEGPLRSRKRKHLGPTILQTCTQEARERILSIKIAEILMGNEPLTQIPSKTNIEEVQRSETGVKSRLLKSLHQPTKQLWSRAQLSSDVNDFYVEDLGPVIVPVVDNLKTKENTDPPDKNSKKVDEETNAAPKSSPKEIAPENSEISPLTQKFSNVTDREYRNTLSSDWSNILNVNSMSDVLVIVKNGEIWAHKLVFHVRCSELLPEIESNEDTNSSEIREKINWPDVDFLTGIAFLEFVYSGVIEKYKSIFETDSLVDHLKKLAKRYHLKSLSIYLRKKKDEIRDLKKLDEPRGLRTPIIVDALEMEKTKKLLDEVHEISSEDEKKDNRSIAEESNEKKDVILESNETYESPLNLSNIDSFINKNYFPAQQNSNDHEIEEINTGSQSSVKTASSKSPDIFEKTNLDTEKSKNSSLKRMKVDAETLDISIEEIQSSGEENSNLKILAQLIADDISPARSQKLNSSPLKSEILSMNVLQSNLLDSANKKSPENNEVEQSKSKVSLERTSFLQKEKSDLSLFIEKIKKINAVPAEQSYSDNEFEVNSIVRRRFRNPFNVNNESNLFRETSSTPKNESPDNTAHENSLEKTTETPEENSLEKSKNASLRSIPIDLEQENFEELSTDEEDISMYSKYKKTKMHENSISRYRNALTELEKTVAEPTIEDDKNSTKMHAIDLTQESDEETTHSKSTEPEKESNKIETTKCVDSSDVDMFEMDDDVLEHSSHSLQNTSQLSHLSLINNNDDCPRDNKNCDEKRNSQSPVNLHNLTPISDEAKISVNSLEFPDLNEADFSKEYPDILTQKLNNSEESDEILTQVPKGDKRSQSLSPTSSQSTLIMDRTSRSPIVISSSPDTDSNFQQNEKIHLEKESFPESPQREFDLDRFSPLCFNDFHSPRSSTSCRNLSKYYDKDRELDDSPSSVRKLKSRSISMPETRQKNGKEQVLINSNSKFKKCQKSPPNYDAMNTPELKRELDKYGIKPQKRKRARQLLNHIYEELRRKAGTDDSLSSSEDNDYENDDFDEPPAKKKSNVDEKSNEKSKDVANPTSIKEAFVALLESDKELHIKVLTYQPLSFESLLSTLKAQGLKCNQNEVMDFLDEECITFQTSATKSRTRKPKGNKGMEKKKISKSSEKLQPN